MEQETEVSNADSGDEAVTIQTGGDSGNDSNEERARQLGWVPKEQYKGPPEKWRSAEEFIDYGEKTHPILKERLNMTMSRVEKLEAELREKDEDIKKFSEFHRSVESRAYAKALETLKAQRKEAVDRGDGEAFQQAEEAIANLEKPREPEKPKVNREFQEWLSENSWYAEDKKKQRVADGIALELINEMKKNGQQGPPPKEFYRQVEQLTRKEYPELFETKRAMPSVEGASGGSRPSSKKQSYENLPADAKKACDRFVKQGLLTKEQYVKDYQWE